MWISSHRFFIARTILKIDPQIVALVSLLNEASNGWKMLKNEYLCQACLWESDGIHA